MAWILVFLAGLVTGVLIPLVTWLVKPEWVRQKLGSEEPPEPEPHYAADIQMAALEADPVIGEPAREANARGAELGWQTQHRAPRKLQEGYDFFRGQGRLRPRGLPRGGDSRADGQGVEAAVTVEAESECLDLMRKTEFSRAGS